ncbi:hypothetical protein [Actinomadura madurae]|uniref:hypothetical protein n=3 Tax=Actinomadura madurae TaxID=1993 RepID=UPI0035579162
MSGAFGRRNDRVWHLRGTCGAPGPAGVLCMTVNRRGDRPRCPRCGWTGLEARAAARRSAAECPRVRRTSRCRGPDRLQMGAIRCWNPATPRHAGDPGYRARPSRDRGPAALPAFPRRRPRTPIRPSSTAGSAPVLGLRNLGRRPHRSSGWSRFQRVEFEMLRGIVTQGISEGEFVNQNSTATSFAIIGMCEYVVNWYQEGRGLRPEELAAYYGRLAYRMCAKRTHDSERLWPGPALRGRRRG